MAKKIENYMDVQGKITAYPAGQEIRMQILQRIVSDLKMGQRYTEKEINQAILSKIAFSDYELLRRELYQYRYVNRERDGAIRSHISLGSR